MKCIYPLPVALAAILACSTVTQGHSWVEQLRLVASNGTFVGTPGYPRGFVPRTSLAYSDFVSQNQIPPNGRPTGNEILSSDLICSPTQRVGNHTAGNPALVAAPGDNIALIYQENGHVTLLDRSPTKPVGSGTIFIYGTKQPSSDDAYLGIHRVWNVAGTGGDKRGKLLATRPFDDGQCYQNNTSELAQSRRAKLGTAGNDLKCQADIQLPQDAGTSGTYTLYWVWEWPTLDNTTGAVLNNESYTTCMDIQMTPEKLNEAGSFDSKQLVDSRAIKAELSTAFLVDPTAAEQLTTTRVLGANRTTPTADSGGAAHAPAQMSSMAAGGVITVTVTATPTADVETVTVTATETVLNGATSQAVIQSAATPSPAPTSSETSENTPLSSQDAAPVSSAAPATRPKVEPFLTPESSVITGGSSTPNTLAVSGGGLAAKGPATMVPAASPAETPTPVSAARCSEPTRGPKRRRRRNGGKPSASK